MHKPRREMSFLDIGVLLFALAAAHGVYEILPRAPACALARARLLLATEEGLVLGIPVDRHVTLGTIKNISDAVAVANQTVGVLVLTNAAFVIGHPVTDLEDKYRLLAILVEVERRNLRVRRRLVVIEHEMIAGGIDLRRQRHTEPPAGDVHLVNALVANVAVAVIPVPVPVVMETVRIELALRRRTEP